MRTSLMLVMALLLSACKPAARPANSETYVLAISWQPAFCESAPRKPECRSQTARRLDARQFSLHGLWPQPGSSTWCATDAASIEADKNGRWRDIAMPRLSQPLWQRLQLAMAGTQSDLHRHEWIKHGTCMAGVDAETYFGLSLALLDKVNASALGRLFAANSNSRITASQIRNAFEENFGKGSGERLRIACFDDGKRRLVIEITIGLKGMLAAGQLDNAAFSALVLAAPKTDPGCPGGLVDIAGVQ